MSNLADLNAPRFTDEQREIVARFDAAPFPAEVLLAHLVSQSAGTIAQTGAEQ